VFDPGASGDQSLHRRGNRVTRRPIRLKRLSAGKATKGRGCMIGAISNWPISMPPVQQTNEGL